MRPIDVQLNINTSLEIAKINSSETNKGDLVFKKNLESEVAVVNESGKTEKPLVDEDGQKQKKDNEKKKGKRKKKKKDSTSMFDISI